VLLPPVSSAPNAVPGSRSPNPQTAGSAAAVLWQPENSVPNAAVPSLRTTAGNAAAVQPSPVSSAPNAAAPSPLTTAPGPAPAARRIPVNSVPTAEQRSLQVSHSISATSAAGSLPTPPRHHGSARSAAIPLTTAISFNGFQSTKRRMNYGPV